MANPLSLIGVLVAGLFEGYAFHRSHVWVPEAMHGQFEFTRFIMLKIFVAGVGTSLLVNSVVSLSRPQKNRGFLRACAGLAILGVGMALAYSGPTLIAVQIGSGVASVAVAFVGCLIGSLLFTMAEGVCPALSKTTDAVFIDRFFRIPYRTVAVPAGLALLGGAALLEYFAPNATDGRVGGFVPALNPIIVGVIVGLNQFVYRIITDSGRGTSGAITSISYYVTFRQITRLSNFAVRSVKDAVKITFVFGSLLGAHYAARTHGEWGNASLPHGPALMRALMGGVLMQFGARLAAGCTCGHGVTGVSELSFVSLAGTCCMFGAAIAATVYGL